MELPKYFLDYKVRNSSQFPTQAEYEELKGILKLKKGERFADLGRSKKFRIQSTYKLETRNGEEVIVWRSTEKKILRQSEFFDAMKRFHDDTGHPGRDITIKKLQEVYAAAPRRLVEAYIKHCGPCNNLRPIPKLPVGKPIYAKGPLERIQIDLVDMRSKSKKDDDEYKWILHVRDHFSKYSWAFPLKRKTCYEVTNALKHLFYSFGPPSILQCDNGGEFTGKEMQKMVKEYFPAIKIIHSRARHTQTNGLIERGNGVLETRLAAHMIGHEGHWSSFLSPLIFHMNTSFCRPIKSTPFEAFFGRKLNVERQDTIEEAVDLDEDDDEFTDNEIEKENLPPENEGAVVEVEKENMEPLPQLWVLYEIHPPICWAVAELKSKKTHSKNFFLFKIVQVLETGPCAELNGKFISVGDEITWAKIMATDHLGTNLSNIESRLQIFWTYLNDRKKQGDRYLRKVSLLKTFSTGDTVSLPITRLDRSNTCPLNLPCLVLQNA